MVRAPDGPNLHVLQYLGRAPQPSSVQLMSASVLRGIGIGYLILGIIPLEGLLELYTDWCFLWRSDDGGWSSHHDDWWFDSYLANLFDPIDGSSPWHGPTSVVLRGLCITPAFWVVLVLLITAVLALCIAPAVRRGHAGAARFGILCMIPDLAIVAVLAALCMALALFNLIGLFGFNDRILAVLFVPGLLLGFVTLLLVDLLACLRWISRAPLAEMPKRKFMPKRAE